MIEHTGEVHLSNCPSVFGDPSPISGASHKCLIPFISVACDTSVYPFGTIFEVAMLDKVEIAMPPSGKYKMKLRRLRIFGQRDKLKANRSKGA